jgi:DNA-directed RNA polymerase subunit RPC12/RpoP
MPIRFRCAYCNQLMGIATRKQGTVVRCPKCSGQVVVPATSETGLTPAPRPTPSGDRPAEVQAGPGSPFEFGDSGSSESMVEPFDVVTADSPAGVFLTSKHLVLAGVLIVISLLSAFFLGWFLRGS